MRRRRRKSKQPTDTNDLVRSLVETPENQFLERKGARIKPRDLADVIVGFANGDGGRIVIGIHDGKVEGTGADSERRVNGWRRANLEHVRPPAPCTIELLACRNERGQEDELVVLEIEASSRIHRNAKGEVFLRTGDVNRKLSVLESQELLYDKGESAFDGTVLPEAGVDPFDEQAVASYMDAIRARDATTALIARGLALEEEDRLQATTAGLLMFGKMPQQVFPEAFVRVLRYQGAFRETGARGNVVSDRRIEGAIPDQIKGARRLLRRWIPASIRLGSEGQFGSEPLLPEAVWLEAIVNAVTHRSYSIGGDHIRIELFSDRLEVYSPGRLPGLVQPENIRESRFARNPRIARAMSDLGFGRELGEGVRRMFEEMARAGLPDPIYVQTASSVRVTLLADPLARRILERLPQGSERFAEMVDRRGEFTTSDATEYLGVSRPTARKYLNELERSGLIEHVGTGPKDPRGFWRVTRGG